MDGFIGKLFPFMGKPKEEPPKPQMKTDVDFKQRRGRARGTTSVAPGLTASQLEEFKMTAPKEKDLSQEESNMPKALPVIEETEPAKPQPNPETKASPPETSTQPQKPSRLKYFGEKLKKAYRRSLREKIASRADRIQLTEQPAAKSDEQEELVKEKVRMEELERIKEVDRIEALRLQEEERIREAFKIEEEVRAKEALRLETLKLEAEAKEIARLEALRVKEEKAKEAARLEVLKKEQEVQAKEEAQLAALKLAEEEKAKEAARIEALKLEEEKKIQEAARLEVLRQEQEKLKETAKLEALRLEEEEKIKEAARLQALKKEQEQLEQEVARQEALRLEEERRSNETARLEKLRLEEERIKEVARFEAVRIEEEERSKEKVRLEQLRLEEEQRVQEVARNEALRLEEEKRKEVAKREEEEKAKQALRLKQEELAKEAARLEEEEKAKEALRLKLEEQAKEEVRLEEEKAKEVARLEELRLKEEEQDKLRALQMEEEERLKEAARLETTRLEEEERKNRELRLDEDAVETENKVEPASKPESEPSLVDLPNFETTHNLNTSIQEPSDVLDSKRDLIQLQPAPISEHSFQAIVPEPSIPEASNLPEPTDLHKPQETKKQLTREQRDEQKNLAALKQQIEEERRVAMAARVERITETKRIVQREQALAAQEALVARQARELQIERERLARENWKIELDKQRVLDDQRKAQMLLQKSQLKQAPLKHSKADTNLSSADKQNSEVSDFAMQIKSKAHPVVQQANPSKQAFDQMCRHLQGCPNPGSVQLIDLNWTQQSKQSVKPDLSSFVLSPGSQHVLSELYFVEKFPASQTTKQSVLESEGVGLVWKHQLPIRGIETLVLRVDTVSTSQPTNPEHRQLYVYTAAEAGLVILPIQVSRTCAASSSQLSIKISGKGRAVEKQERETHLGKEDKDWTLHGQRLGRSQRNTVYWVEMPDSILELQNDQVIRRVRVKLRGSYQTTPFKVEFLTGFVENKDTLLLLISCTKTDFKQLLIKNLKEEVSTENVVVFGNSKLWLTERSPTNACK